MSSARMRLAATGDVALVRDLSHGGDMAGEPWRVLAEADLATVNLELPLTRSVVAAEKPFVLRGDPELACTLRELSITVANMANNHALDYGIAGLRETLEALRAAGIASVGAGRDLAEALQPAIVEAKGVRVGFLGFASTLPPGFAAGEDRPGIAPIRAYSSFRVDPVSLAEQPGIAPWVQTISVPEDVDRAVAQVRRVSSEVDCLVLHLHWGIPNGWCAAFQGPLADYQRPLAHALITAGADLIVGHHPHAIHGVERHGRGLVAYSLGHFLFHTMGSGAARHPTTQFSPAGPPYSLESLQSGDARDALILDVELGSHGAYDARFLPVRLDESGEPRLLRDAEAQRALARLVAQSAALGTELVVDGDEAVSKRSDSPPLRS
jgi:poly-gamma-glutamate capsule biosynthesis protein CapA/YwtB (metallophosphatase superfamily)